MRLTVLAFVMLSFAAQAQETALPSPEGPAAQSQSCPVGMVWDQNAAACAVASGGASPINDLSIEHDCDYGAPREVMS
ncbi:hypothetical protein [Yoonia sp. BS5-3]|uniref:Uncharacterized protein n=1 Tax=Yoonia phaeophyticola TaxID=3137369 RepID=A0ABZ2UYV5_9RHOB